MKVNIILLGAYEATAGQNGLRLIYAANGQRTADIQCGEAREDMV